MADLAARFAAIIVTYGDRAALVDAVVNSLTAITAIRYVIIIDNNSHTKLSYTDPRVVVLHQETNTGSAGGYRIGIDFALTLPDLDYLILLDDDLIPLEGALHASVGYATSGISDLVPVIPRDDRPGQRGALDRERSDRIIRNSFHDFHIAGRLTRRRHKTLSKGVLPVDYAPYGGMVIPIVLARRAERPDASLFLYCDDYDYVMKLSAAGGTVALCDVTPLRSIDVSWNQRRTIAPAAFDPAAPPMRVYYAMRNRVIFEKRYIINCPWIYMVNAFVFFILGMLVSAVENRRLLSLAHARLLIAAVRDGWTGQISLGPARISQHR